MAENETKATKASVSAFLDAGSARRARGSALA
jgi:hypothetical protein